jgi:hypothetical protein
VNEPTLHIMFDNGSYILRVIDSLVWIEQDAPLIAPPHHYPLTEWPVLNGRYWDLYTVERVLVLYRFLLDLDDTPANDSMPLWWEALTDSEKLAAAKRIVERLHLLTTTPTSTGGLPMCMESPLQQVKRLMEQNKRRPAQASTSWAVERGDIQRGNS